MPRSPKRSSKRLSDTVGAAGKALVREMSAIFRRKQEATQMMVYLNNATFTGRQGQVLAHQVRQAWANQLPILLVHEVDPERHLVTKDA